jgi:hypothetical protein
MLTVMDVGKSKIKVLTDSVPDENLLCFIDGTLLLCSHMAEE